MFMNYVIFVYKETITSIMYVWRLVPYYSAIIPGYWKVLSPTYFPMYFVWWWEYPSWC